MEAAGLFCLSANGWNRFLGSNRYLSSENCKNLRTFQANGITHLSIEITSSLWSTLIFYLVVIVHARESDGVTSSCIRVGNSLVSALVRDFAYNNHSLSRADKKRVCTRSGSQSFIMTAWVNFRFDSNHYQFGMKLCSALAWNEGNLFLCELYWCEN